MSRPGHTAGAVRRGEILALLGQVDAPIPGDVLADQLGISRQVIVNDVAILRASGSPIVATVRGYLLVPTPDRVPQRATIAVRHGPDEAADELLALVDLGIRVVDVIVEHPVYGEMRGQLQLASRADVEGWVAATRASGAHLLSELTDGVHLHTVEASSAELIDRARSALAARGYLLEPAG